MMMRTKRVLLEKDLILDHRKKINIFRFSPYSQQRARVMGSWRCGCENLSWSSRTESDTTTTTTIFLQPSQEPTDRPFLLMTALTAATTAELVDDAKDFLFRGFWPRSDPLCFWGKCNRLSHDFLIVVVVVDLVCFVFKGFSFTQNKERIDEGTAVKWEILEGMRIG